MKKIPTLFVRDPDDRSRVLPKVTPGCEWVLNGGGVATAKWDGTCILIDASGEYARREVKPGKDAPDGFMEVDYDPVTGKRFGWEPIEQSAFVKFFREAVASGWPNGAEPAFGTYELCGPKINGNPHEFWQHFLLPHAASPLAVPLKVTTLGSLASFREWLESLNCEGIVWHHPDGRRAKLKRRDLGLPWPVKAVAS